MATAACLFCSSPREAGTTTSTCTSETIQGKHLFRISGYSKIKGRGVGAFIMSGKFNVGGYDWAIRYYPDGDEQKNQDYISVFLKLMSKNTEARAFFDLRLVNHATGLSCSMVQQAKTPVFKNPSCPGWGISKFKKRSELEASAYIGDDCLIIECIVAVIKSPQVSDTKKLFEIEVPPSNLSKHLGKLLEEKKGADVTFRVDGETFAAHRMVLAVRSPVFEAELYGPMREKDTPCIVIDDMQPTVFKALLHFIYTDSLLAMDGLDNDDNKEMFRHLLVAADRYGIERLKLLCEHILSKSLDVESVATTLVLADQNHCSKLKDACVEFIASLDRKEDVVASQGYGHLKSICPSAIVELFERMTRARKT